jgi:hypothetical protein
MLAPPQRCHLVRRLRSVGYHQETSCTTNLPGDASILGCPLATPEQRARRRAQRETAKAVKEHRTRLGAQTRQARQTRQQYLDYLVDNPGARPEKGTEEGRSLAREAGLARWNKADKRYLVFADYWYHADDEEDEDLRYEEGGRRQDLYPEEE